MTKILLIETATEVCSAAIAADGVIFCIEEVMDTLSHAGILTTLIGHCTEQSGISLPELDAVAISYGPGSYTSLRVGISVAKGICYALQKPLIAVDTLQALARASTQERADEPVFYLPMVDARRNEVWTSIYDNRFRQLIMPQPLILENNSFINYLSEHLKGMEQARLVVSGNGAEKVRSVTIPENTVWSPIKKCSAKYLCDSAFLQFQKGDFQDIAYFEPLYMKSPNITTSNKSAWHEKP